MRDYRKIESISATKAILPQLRDSLNIYYAGNRIWSLNYKLGYVVFEAYCSLLFNTKDFSRLCRCCVRGNEREFTKRQDE